MRRLLLAMLVLAVVTPLIGYAVLQSWHRLAEVVGVVRPPPITLVPVAVDLGELGAGQRFAINFNTSLTCGTRCNVTKIVVAVPRSPDEWYSMVSAFWELRFSVTVDVITLCAPSGAPGVTGLCLPEIPLVVNGRSAINPGSDSEYWKFEHQDDRYSYYSFRGTGSSLWRGGRWIANPLAPGRHTVYASIVGETSTPTRQVSLRILIYLEIVPA